MFLGFESFFFPLVNFVIQLHCLSIQLLIGLFSFFQFLLLILLVYVCRCSYCNLFVDVLNFLYGFIPLIGDSVCSMEAIDLTWVFDSKCAPRLSAEAQEMLSSHFVSLRKQVQQVERDNDERSSIPITIR